MQLQLPFYKENIHKAMAFYTRGPGIHSSLEVLLWWFLAHFKQPWNEVLVLRKETHLGSTCVLSSLLQSFDWFRANIKYLLFARYKALGEKHLQIWRNFWESKRNISILHFAWEKNCWHSYLDIIQIISIILKLSDPLFCIHMSSMSFPVLVFHLIVPLVEQSALR